MNNTFSSQHDSENINNIIEIEKRRYVDYINANRDKHILIYGGGKQAKSLAQFLTEINVSFEAFCVSNAEANVMEIFEKKVLDFSSIGYRNDEVAFLIGVREQLNDEIITYISSKGYTNYLPSSSAIRYLGASSRNFYFNPMIEITTKLGCSVNCKFCPQDVFIKEYLKNDGSERKLTFENFKKCCDKLPKNVLIEFAGFTEPFLNQDCINMITYAKLKGYRLSIFTTLCGVTEEIVDKLLEIQFEEFVYHAPDVEGYSIIPINDNYLNLVRRLVSAKKTNGDNFIDYVCTQGTVPDNIKSILGNDVRIYVVLNDRAGNLKNDSLYGKHNLCGALNCELAYDINHNVLLPDGRVILCSNDWGMKHVLGNLLEQSYDEIINGRESSDIHRAMNSYDDEILCRNCFQAVCRNEKLK
jgi:radical SAM protein with 4Fe4S-binding SPASM domain